MSDRRRFAPEFHSAVEGIRWPAIGARGSQRLMSILFQLEQSQWWAPETIQERQFRQATALLRHARETVPYYRDKPGSTGNSTGKAASPEGWASIPVLLREDVQAAGVGLHSARIPKGHGRTLKVQTSGSTGRPVKGLHTELSAFLIAAINLRGHLWFRRDFTRKLGVIRDFKGNAAPFPHGDSSPNWSRTVEAIAKSGPSVALNINTTTIEQQIDWMRRNDPTYLLCFPTVLHEMARRCIEQGIGFSSLSEVATIGEVVTPEIRAACRKAWGVPLVDTYSSQEIGTMALQCPEHEHYHVQAESFLMEILDDDGRPAAPGELGRVVVTNLHNFAMPMIRYWIGDYAEAGAPCPCGRGLPVVNRFVGRVRNLIVLPTGDRMEPGYSAETFTDVAAIRQFQVIQTAPTAMTIKVVVDPPLSGDQTARISENLWALFGYRFDFTFEHVDEIPRSAVGKFEDFMVAFTP